MKPWMKILMWLGLGGGIGFFAGYQFGVRTEKSRSEEREQHAYYAWRVDEVTDQAMDALDNYRGGDFDGDHVCVIPDDDPPMVEEPPVIGDEEEIEEIPELHPQHMIPEQINEEDYYNNPWGYDQESLVYYEMDEVLYDKDTRNALKTKDEQDQVVGIGMLFNFYLKDGEALDAIFVKNDTMGVIFRIDRLDAAYTDEIDGGDSPEYEEDDQD